MVVYSVVTGGTVRNRTYLRGFSYRCITSNAYVPVIGVSQDHPEPKITHSQMLTALADHAQKFSSFLETCRSLAFESDQGVGSADGDEHTHGDEGRARPCDGVGDPSEDDRQDEREQVDLHRLMPSCLSPLRLGGQVQPWLWVGSLQPKRRMSTIMATRFSKSRRSMGLLASWMVVRSTMFSAETMIRFSLLRSMRRSLRLRERFLRLTLPSVGVWTSALV
jgi:hypothetical protein